jgi:hypothetical protein
LARVAAVNSEIDLIEADDHWRLPVVGMTVDQCCFDFAIVLKIGSGNDSWDIRISQPLIFETQDGMDHLVIPEGLINVEVVLRLLRLTIQKATAYKDGGLELRFAEGAVLRVPPDAAYEAWEIAGPNGIKVFALPGGELAVWRATLDPDH